MFGQFRATSLPAQRRRLLLRASALPISICREERTGMTATMTKPAQVTQTAIPLLDLVAQFNTIRDEVMPAIARVCESQRFIGGPEVTACEEEVARYSGCRHGIGMTSGSDALLCGMMALDIGPGDEVIVPSFTFFATAGCV